MKVRYFLDEGQNERDTADSAALFLRTEKSWCSWFPTRQTRYEGWFISDSTTTPHGFTKIIERIDYEEASIKSVSLSRDAARWEYSDNNSLTFFPLDDKNLPLGSSGLSILARYPIPLVCYIDVRGMYQEPTVGRFYQLTEEKGGLLICYNDSVLGKSLYLFLRGMYPDQASEPELWHSVSYPRDTARHSPPDNLYVYRLSLQPSERIDWGVGWTADDAKKACDYASQRTITEAILFPPQTPSISNEAAAFSLTEQALRNLHTTDGYYAGLPWFHQVWSRDELITALGFSEDAQKEIIGRYLSLPVAKGELPTFAGSGTTCADGVGWLALLIQEYGLSKLSPELHSQAHSFFTNAYAQLKESRWTPSGLIWSEWNATWMDTIGRTGYRLEIQCMAALVLQHLELLTGDSEEKIRYAEERRDLLKTIRHRFYGDGYLFDGLGEDGTADTRKRPNPFLAYILQPDLLTKAEWTGCFDILLTSLSTSWGGLTSLDQQHPEFRPTSSGQDNISYHQGDSWFFINNLAALALSRLDPIYFEKAIQRLLEASTNETLTQHFLGCPGEIASASDGTSWGCGIQGFSGGTYLRARKTRDEKYKET